MDWSHWLMSEYVLCTDSPDVAVVVTVMLLSGWQVYVDTAPVSGLVMVCSNVVSMIIVCVFWMRQAPHSHTNAVSVQARCELAVNHGSTQLMCRVIVSPRAPGETRTHTERILRPLPLPIGLLGLAE